MAAERKLAAIMFTDIEGFTALMQSDEDLALAKRDKYRSVLEEEHEVFGGTIVQWLGDGSLSTFPNSVDAVACAVAVQQAFREPLEVPVRIGIHVGNVMIEPTDIVGDAVNIAARIESFGFPGAVMVSDSVQDQVRNQPAFSFVDLGRYKLKNVGRPFVIYAIATEGLAVPAPDFLHGKGEAVGVESDRIPVVHNEFIGRRDDLAAVTGALDKHRLVTVTGPGGVGKTRLAVEVAVLLQSSLGGGWFADLAKFRQPELVGAGIRTGLGIPDQPGLSELEVSVDHLARRRGLLVIDNCEHVLSAAADAILRILRRAPGITVMATSRERLGLSEESVWPLRPLLEGDELADAVLLFLTRAEAVNPRLDLDEETDTIRELCRELDGLPLAIELAASRCSVMTPEQILERMSDLFRLLRRRHADDRHGSLRATVDWSYELLDADEAAVFETLAVFPAGFTLDMAEQLTPAAGVDRFDTFDILASLIDKSLIVAESGPTRRYRYLETLRSYALDRAGETGRQAAADALAEWAQRTADTLELATIQVADREVANLEAAVGHLIDDGDGRRAFGIMIILQNPLADHHATWHRLLDQLLEATEDPQLRAAVGAELAYMFFYGSHIERAQAAAANAISTAGQAGLAPPSIALTITALIAAFNDDAQGARELITEAKRVAQQGDSFQKFTAEIVAVWVHLGADEIDAAVRAAERGLELSGKMNPITVMGLELQAALAFRITDPPRALELMNKNVSVARQSGQHFWLSLALSHRGFTHIRLRDPTAALGDFLEALPHATAVGNWRVSASTCETIAAVLTRQGRLHDAAVLLAASLAERTRRRTDSGTRIDSASRDRVEEQLRAELGEEFDAAWGEGTTLPEGQVYQMATRLAQELLDGGKLE